ncbi:MAG: 16S rRNA (uracil(1498)-N(3))-methyltransferase [Ruminococcaceae bacterium]|nr:16S rRNA (uracil(1498)-N(3))-methyltransferase [Oscillospiraceae bacterium]
MSKFFIEKSQIKDNKACIVGDDVAHLVKVLRVQTGDKLLLCDGDGTDFETKVSSVSKEQVVVDILDSHPSQTEPTTEVTLYQGLPKQGKMEWIIEKCTEMGISRIVPVQMERSVVRLSAEQAEKKQQRWAKTAEAAAKQCGRGKIPEVCVPVALSSLKREALPEFLLLPYEAEKSHTMQEALQENRAKSVGIFIGPEGGFAEKEVLFLQELGAKCVTLGPRILRTETAGLAALTILLYEWGDLS